MGQLLMRLLVNAVALWVAARVVPGIGLGEAAGQGAVGVVLVVALIFGVVNAMLRPLVAFFTCPFYVLTLGLFTFVVNALMLLLTAGIAGALGQPFQVEGFGAALLGSIVISVVSFLLSFFLGGDKKREARRE